MWQFMDNHPVIAVVFFSLLVLIVATITIVIINIAKKNGLKARVAGNEIEIGGQKAKRIQNDTDTVRDAILLCTSVSQWRNQLNKKIESKTEEVVSTSIRHAVTIIDNEISMAKLEYGAALKSKKAEITNEDNYQIIICGFLMDQVKEIFKNIICGAIREDHFEDKTDAEIESIGETAFTKAKIIFEEKSEILQKDIIRQIREKYENKVKKITNELIEVTALKYKNLKKEIEETIVFEENKFRTDLAMKFPKFSSDVTDSLVNYYS